MKSKLILGLVFIILLFSSFSLAYDPYAFQFLNSSDDTVVTIGGEHYGDINATRNIMTASLNVTDIGYFGSGDYQAIIPYSEFGLAGFFSNGSDNWVTLGGWQYGLDVGGDASFNKNLAVDNSIHAQNDITANDQLIGGSVTANWASLGSFYTNYLFSNFSGPVTIYDYLNVTNTTYLDNDKCSAGDFLTSDTTTGEVSCDTPTSGGTSYWNQSDDYLFPINLSKKVGIGTNSPDVNLDINGSGDVEVTIQSSDNNAILNLEADTGNTASGSAQDIRINLLTGGTKKAEMTWIEQDDAFAINAYTFDNNQFVVSGTNKRVGIGTFTPSEALEVNGNIKITGNGIIDDNLTVNGFVGINTTSPTSALEVNGILTFTNESPTGVAKGIHFFDDFKYGIEANTFEDAETDYGMWYPYLAIESNFLIISSNATERRQNIFGNFESQAIFVSSSTGTTLQLYGDDPYGSDREAIVLHPGGQSTFSHGDVIVGPGGGYGAFTVHGNTALKDNLTVDGLMAQNAYGVVNTFGSQNPSFNHVYSTAIAGFAFNKDIDLVSSGGYNFGSASYYANGVNYKVLYDRGCIVDIDSEEAKNLIKNLGTKRISQTEAIEKIANNDFINNTMFDMQLRRDKQLDKMKAVGKKKLAELSLDEVEAVRDLNDQSLAITSKSSGLSAEEKFEVAAVIKEDFKTYKDYALNEVEAVPLTEEEEIDDIAKLFASRRYRTIDVDGEIYYEGLADSDGKEDMPLLDYSDFPDYIYDDGTYIAENDMYDDAGDTSKLLYRKGDKVQGREGVDVSGIIAMLISTSKAVIYENEELLSRVEELEKELSLKKLEDRIKVLEEMLDVKELSPTEFNCFDEKHILSDTRECPGGLSSINDDGLQTRCYNEISGWYVCSYGWMKAG